MTILEFAKASGVVFMRCEESWGGTWGYRRNPKANLSVCGFKTKSLAAEGWLRDLMKDEKPFEVIKQLIEESRKELKSLREFKRKHDEQLMKVLGSPTHKELVGQRTIGYARSLANPLRYL